MIKDKQCFYSKFQRSNILDDRNKKGNSQEKKKSKNLKRTKKKKTNSKINSTRKTSKKREDFLRKFNVKEHQNFRSSYQFPQNNFSKLRQLPKKNTKKHFKKGELSQIFIPKTVALIEEGEIKEVNQGFNNKRKKKSIMKKMSKLFKTQEEESFKDIIYQDKEKVKFKSYLGLFRNKKNQVKHINSIDKPRNNPGGIKNKLLMKSSDIEYTSKRKQVPRRKVICKKKKAHSKSPQALKKNILDKSTLLYKPMNTNKFEFHRKVKHNSLEKKIEKILEKKKKDEESESENQRETKRERNRGSITDRIKNIIINSEGRENNYKWLGKKKSTNQKGKAKKKIIWKSKKTR